MGDANAESGKRRKPDPAEWARISDEELAERQRQQQARLQAETDLQAQLAGRREHRHGKTGRRLVIVVGYVSAVLFPLGGLIIGLILYLRSRDRHGIWIMAVSGAVLIISIIVVVLGL